MESTGRSMISTPTGNRVEPLMMAHDDEEAGVPVMDGKEPVRAGGGVPVGYPGSSRAGSPDSPHDQSKGSHWSPGAAWIALRKRMRYYQHPMVSPCTKSCLHPENAVAVVKKQRPAAQAVLALPLLLVMGGVLAIICLGQARFIDKEPGQGWRSLTLADPFAMELVGDPIYTIVSLTVNPWEDQALGAVGVYQQTPKQGYRRRSLLRSRHFSADDAFTRLGNILMADGSDGSGGRRLSQVTETTVPILEIFIAQDLLGSGSPSSYVNITGIHTCTYKIDASNACVAEFRRVVRPDPSLPAVMITRISYPTSDPGMHAAAEISVVQMGQFGLIKEWIALIILVLVLLGIAFEVFHRMWIAFIGAFSMTGLLLLGNAAPPLAHIVTWIDYGTLTLLFGMMLIVGQLQRTGVFQVMCAACLRFSKGKLLILTLSLCLTTCFLSAWLDNVTTVLLMVPMTIEVFEVMKKDPIPLLIAQAILSNVGGCTTMIGDSSVIIIGNQLRHSIGFIDYLMAMAPGVALVIPFALTTLVLLHRADLAGHVENFEEVISIVDKYTITEWALFYKCIYVTGAVIIGFLLQPIHGLAPAWIAVIGATVLIVATEPKDVHAVLHAVEWDMLLFFAAMFILIEAAAELGLIRRIVQFLQLVIDTAPPGSEQIAAIEAILWFSAIFSALLDNVPYVITMLPVIEQLAALRPELDLRIMAWSLAFGACLGGNATMIGASANIVTVGLAAERGYPITFGYWLKTGVPTTIMAVAAANIYLIARYGFA